MNISTYNIDLTSIAVRAALKAGEILRNGFGSKFEIETKSTPHDIVTKFDKAAETAIIQYIQKLCPTHAFCAEESGLIETPNAPVYWIIDPLDGTLNFAHHIPTFCVSIAAVVEKTIKVGVVYHPLLDELFVAEKGYGAYLNDQRIRVSETDDPHMAIMATGFPYDSLEIRSKSINTFAGILKVGNPMRLIGSAALSLAYVAAGRFDAFWNVRLNPWDFAAGRLLVEEAGGSITDFNQNPLENMKASNILSSNTRLHKRISEYLV